MKAKRIIKKMAHPNKGAAKRDAPKVGKALWW
jgi:hypothetical protein